MQKKAWLDEGYGLAIIDLETGSVDIFRARLLEIGIIFTDRYLQLIGYYTAYIADDTRGTLVTANALKVNRLNIEQVERGGRTKQELLKVLKSIQKIHEERYGIKKWIPAAWHTHFDLPILMRYLGKYYKEFFHYRCIDIPSIVWGRMGTLEGLLKIAEKLGLKVDEKRAHSALYDAWLAYEVLRRVLKEEVV